MNGKVKNRKGSRDISEGKTWTKTRRKFVAEVVSVPIRKRMPTVEECGMQDRRKEVEGT